MLQIMEFFDRNHAAQSKGTTCKKSDTEQKAKKCNFDYVFWWQQNQSFSIVDTFTTSTER